MIKHIKALLLILPLVLLTGLFFLKTSTVENKSVSSKYKTPQELKAAVIKQKLEKRAAGWAKPDKPSEFLKFHKNIRTKDGDTQTGYKQNYKLNELNKLQTRKPSLKSANVKQNWIERGPGNVSGRTRGLIVDPDDTSGNTWFTGSVGGGIWKTSNAGGSWTNLTPNIPNLATVCIAMASSNTQVMYAGTGEGFGNTDAIIGDGIFKTNDKGNNWTQLPSTINNDDFLYVNRIVVDPENENIVIAVTNTAIKKSINGGQSWNTVYDNNTAIQHIIANPTNFNVLYATAKYIGVIKSEDKGDNWELVFEHDQGRIELAIAPSAPNTIYALNENSELYVSNNGGNSWSPTTHSTSYDVDYLGGQGWYNNTLAVYPNNPDKLIIGGINLYEVNVNTNSSSSTSYIKVDTVNTASFMQFVNFGADYLGGGIEVNTSKSNYTNIEIQFGPGKTQKAHRFLVPQGATSGVAANQHTYQDYVDVPFEVWDVGNNRQLMVSIRDQDRNGKFNLTEHNDDLLIGREYFWVNDINYSTTPSASIMRNGGNEYEEVAFAWPVLTDGASWTPENLPSSKITINRTSVAAKEISSSMLAHWAGIGAPYVHADLHNIVFTKTATNNTRIIVANDGGVGYSDNLGSSWINPSNGFNTTQFYGIDKHPTENKYIGGLQDNGSWFSGTDPNNLSNWTEATGGDGFDAVWNALDPEEMITSLYYNSLYKSFNGGISWGVIAEDIEDTGEGYSPFITQISYNPTDPEKLYIVGVSGVSRSENFGDTWELSPITASNWGWAGSGYVEASIANPEIVWAGSRMSNNGNVNLSTDGGQTFNATNNFITSMGALSGLATHPFDENTAYALFSFADDAKILRTTNLGQSWEDISGFNSANMNNGFPNVATYCLLVMPHNPSEIWAGTEIGLFISTDNGETWEYSNNGLPAVSIWEMKIREEQIVVATHGRGIWTLDMPQLNDALVAPTLLNVGISPNQQTILQFINQSNYDSLNMVTNGSTFYRINNNYNKNEQVSLPVNLELENGEYSIQLYGYKNGSTVKSAIKEFSKIQLNKPQVNYENNFEDNQDDFWGEGFEVTNFDAVEFGTSIQTDHPYKDRNNISYLLKTPIIVKNNSASILSYRDIPMIEIGENGSIYGSSEFYDYGVVEGSTNGIDWIALKEGYDFREIEDKASKLSINVNSEPNLRLFINHEINLLESFNENDTILIRYRLFSDAYSNGWGWIIDDIKIEHKSLTNVIDNHIDNSHIYPNPCRNELNVILDDNYSATTVINIYDINGRKIKQLNSNNQKQLQINTSDLIPSNYIIEINSGENLKKFKFQVIR